MTIALWCVLAAGILPLVFVGYAKAMGGEYDNHAPRLFLARLTGSAKRAHWAEENGYEAFPLFAAAVLTAHVVGGAIPRVDFLALVFIVARIGHGIAYVADLPTLRTFLWLVGWACTVAIFVTAATSR